MDGSCNRDAPNEIVVILTVGTYTTQFSAKRKENTEPWIGNAPRTFQSEQATVSLVLDGVRTDWKASTSTGRKNGHDVAEFLFDCSNQQLAWRVGISAVKRIWVDSERLFDANHTARSRGKATDVPQYFDGVQIEGETLRLSIGWEKENGLDPGLMIVTSDGLGEPLFFPTPKQRALPKFNPNLQFSKRKGSEYQLSRNNVAAALQKQHHRPTDASAIFHNKRLKLAGLETLTLKVK